MQAGSSIKTAISSCTVEQPFLLESIMADTCRLSKVSTYDLFALDAGATIVVYININSSYYKELTAYSAP
jgi:hypothetical protein